MADNNPVNNNAAALTDVELSDDALERAAAMTAGQGFTMIYCTQDLSCGDF